MSRVLVQLLLSVVVGVSAAVGLGPQAIKIRQEVKASLRERVKVDLPVVGGVTTRLRTNTSVSAQTQVKSVIKENVKADTKVKGNLNVQVNTGTNTNLGGTVLNDVLPQTTSGGPMDSSVTANVQTNASVNTPVVDLDLKNTIRSVLDLNLNP
jgi:hypothetical protein